MVLSGALDDGTAGLRAIKKNGGITIVQDPADASYPAMPENAISNNSVDRIVRAGEIGPLLVQLVNEETRANEADEPAASIRKMLLGDPDKPLAAAR